MEFSINIEIKNFLFLLIIFTIILNRPLSRAYRLLFNCIKALQFINSSYFISWKSFFGILLCFLLTIHGSLNIFICWNDFIIKHGIIENNIFIILLYICIMSLNNLLWVIFIIELKLSILIWIKRLDRSLYFLNQWRYILTGLFKY